MANYSNSLKNHKKVGEERDDLLKERDDLQRELIVASETISVYNELIDAREDRAQQASTIDDLRQALAEMKQLYEDDMTAMSLQLLAAGK